MSEDQSRNAWFTISELNAWAERKLSALGLLAQHPPAPPDACPVCRGVGYDSSGQRCEECSNPSF